MDEHDEEALRAAAKLVVDTRKAWSDAVKARKELIRVLKAKGARVVDLSNYGKVDRTYVDRIVSGRD